MAHPRNRASRLLRFIGFLLLTLFVLINIEAAIQARALTHFEPIDGRAPQVQDLSFGLIAQTLVTGIPVPRPENRHTPAEHYLPFETRRINLNAEEFLEAWYVPHPQPRGIVISFTGYINVKDALLTPTAHFYQATLLQLSVLPHRIAM